MKWRLIDFSLYIYSSPRKTTVSHIDRWGAMCETRSLSEIGMALFYGA